MLSLNRVSACIVLSIFAARPGAFVSSISNALGSHNLCRTINTDTILVKEFETSEDATIFGNQPDIAAGRERFIVGNTPNGERRALLKFQVVEDGPTDFPATDDVRVVCAELRLFAYNQSNNGVDGRLSTTPKIRLHRVTEAWTTSGGIAINGVNGGRANDGDCTWKYRKYPNTEWKNPGGGFQQDEVLSRDTIEDNLHWFGSSVEMNTVVQDWIDGSTPNNGFLLMADDSNVENSYATYHGFENSPEFVPRLIVTYTSPKQGKPHLSDAELAQVFVEPPAWLQQPSRSNNGYSGRTGGARSRGSNSSEDVRLAVVAFVVPLGIVSLIAIWACYIFLIKYQNEEDDESKSAIEVSQRPKQLV